MGGANLLLDPPQSILQQNLVQKMLSQNALSFDRYNSGLRFFIIRISPKRISKKEQYLERWNLLRSKKGESKQANWYQQKLKGR